MHLKNEQSSFYDELACSIASRSSDWSSMWFQFGSMLCRVLCYARETYRRRTEKKKKKKGLALESVTRSFIKVSESICSLEEAFLNEIPN